MQPTAVSEAVLALHGVPEESWNPLFPPIMQLDFSFVDVLNHELPRSDGRPWTREGTAFALAYALRAAGFRGGGGGERPSGRPNAVGTTPLATRDRIVELAGEGYDSEQIAEILDSEGVPTPRGRPKWSATTVAYQVGLSLAAWVPNYTRPW